MKFLNVIEYRKYYLSVAVLFVLASWLCLIIFGLKPGIDLSGGSEWQISFEKEKVELKDIEKVLSESGLKSLNIEKISDRSFMIRSVEIDSLNREKYVQILNEKIGGLKEESFLSIGPSVSKELASKALWAIVLVLVGISLYVAYAFRKVSYPVSSWKYGIATLIALVHDVSIATGFLSLLGVLKNVFVDTNSIVALLVVMGFSVHDTIVVFDRIRENLIKNRGKNFKLEDIINKSVRETFARSVNTSLTLILVLLALALFGPHSLLYFVLTMMVGTFFGTYSSIFIASPLLYLFNNKK